MTDAKSPHWTYVKCCDRNKKSIYLLHANNLFYFDSVDAFPIEYCPWCGILLDTNLLEE